MPITINGTTGIAGVDGSASTPAVQGTDTNTGIFFPAADTIAFGEGGTEAMRIDSSGNVGIGTSSPSFTLDVSGSSATVARVISSNHTGLLRVDATGASTRGGAVDLAQSGTVCGRIGVSGTWEGNTTSDIAVASEAGLRFYSGGSGTERARITSGGDFWVGATSFSNSGSGVNISASNTSGGAAGGLTVLNSASASADSSPPLVIMKAMTTTTSAARFVQFYANTSSQAMGGIVGNGATNVQFASLSDIRDKTNIQSISGSLEKINLLRPVEFDWIADGSHINAGFIAQEVETVFPEFVVENMSSDGQEDRKGLTGGMTGGIIAHLVKAIQELSAKNNALEARLAALEAK